MTKITRRTALAALPAALAPLSAAGAASQAEIFDPVLPAFHAWAEARSAYWGSFGKGLPQEEIDAIHDVELDAADVLADAVPTTPAGLACKAFAAIAVLGVPTQDENPLDEAVYEFNQIAGDQDGRMMRSLLEGARSLARQD